MRTDEGWRVLVDGNFGDHGWAWRVLAIESASPAAITVFAVTRMGAVHALNFLAKTAPHRLIHVDDLADCTAPSLHRGDWQCGVCGLCGGAGRA